MDTNCLTLPDGTPVVFPKGLPIGNCKAGTRSCVAGKWGSCTGVVAPKAKDDCSIPGDDSDCDGVPNSGCECTTGAVRECGVNDVGACKLGTQRCVEGKWARECEGAVYPSQELCDGKAIDEDCDGKTDIEDEQCDCINEEESYCQRPQKSLRGDCKWGKRQCEDGRWSACREWAKRMPEVCGEREPVEGVKWTGDENCDGGRDTSPYNKPGPRGCVDMMLDADRDGYGRIGRDLSQLTGPKQSELLATACLCPSRPDMDKKKAEGWTKATNQANMDCGDCRDINDAVNVNPGTDQSATKANRCLEDVRWGKRIGGVHYKLPFDLNCDGKHSDPFNKKGEIAIMKCEAYGQEQCRPSGEGRLAPKEPGQTEVRCGETYNYGKCVAKYGPKSSEPGSSGTQSGTTSEPRPGFLGCEVEAGANRHQVRCQ